MPLTPPPNAVNAELRASSYSDSPNLVGSFPSLVGRRSANGSANTASTFIDLSQMQNKNRDRTQEPTTAGNVKQKQGGIQDQKQGGIQDQRQGEIQYRYGIVSNDLTSTNAMDSTKSIYTNNDHNDQDQGTEATVVKEVSSSNSESRTILSQTDSSALYNELFDTYTPRGEEMWERGGIGERSESFSERTSYINVDEEVSIMVIYIKMIFL